MNNTLEQTGGPTDLRITIIEAKPMFARGICATLETDRPGSIVNVLTAWDIATPSSETPDLILLSVDYNQEKKALNQVALLNSAFPGTRIVLYDSHEDLKMLPYLLKLGICGYLMANFDAAELKLCIDTIFENRRYISNEIVWDYLNREHTETYPPATQKPQKLSKMEDIVANHLINGLSVTQIAKSMSRQLSTISTVKAKIFRKLQVANVLDLKEKLQGSSGTK